MHVYANHLGDDDCTDKPTWIDNAVISGNQTTRVRIRVPKDGQPDTAPALLVVCRDHAAHPR